jgi:hypothetical protein
MSMEGWLGWALVELAMLVVLFRMAKVMDDG